VINYNLSPVRRKKFGELWSTNKKVFVSFQHTLGQQCAFCAC